MSDEDAYESAEGGDVREEASFPPCTTQRE